MTLEKTLRANALFDVYGSLLTPSQQDVLSCYIVNDESLGEIAERLHISRQAVSDLISRALAKLEHFENKLNFVAKLTKVLGQVEQKAHLLTTDVNLARRITLTYTDLIKSLED